MLSSCSTINVPDGCNIHNIKTKYIYIYTGIPWAPSYFCIKYLVGFEVLIAVTVKYTMHWHVSSMHVTLRSPAVHQRFG
jgi:hypothetical protein